MNKIIRAIIITTVVYGLLFLWWANEEIHTGIFVHEPAHQWVKVGSQELIHSSPETTEEIICHRITKECYIYSSGSRGFVWHYWTQPMVVEDSAFKIIK